MDNDLEIEGHPGVLAMLRALHSHLPEDKQPIARMDFSDAQWARAEQAYTIAREWKS